MNKTLESKLVRKFPLLFSYKNNKEKIIIPIEFGCECGDGWYNIIYDACKKLQDNVDKNKTNQVKFTQIKEKFGGLRLYVGGATDEQYDIIDEAEEKSYKVCEECGSENNIGYTQGWIRTICKSCWKKNYPNEIWKPNEMKG